MASIVTFKSFSALNKLDFSRADIKRITLSKDLFPIIDIALNNGVLNLNQKLQNIQISLQNIKKIEYDPKGEKKLEAFFFFIQKCLFRLHIDL